MDRTERVGMVISGFVMATFGVLVLLWVSSLKGWSAALAGIVGLMTAVVGVALSAVGLVPGEAEVRERAKDARPVRRAFPPPDPEVQLRIDEWGTIVVWANDGSRRATRIAPDKPWTAWRIRRARVRWGRRVTRASARKRRAAEVVGRDEKAERGEVLPEPIRPDPANPRREVVAHEPGAGHAGDRGPGGAGGPGAGNAGSLAMKDCPFCDYAGPSPILKDWAGHIVFKPLNPVTPGHVLVVPKRHYVDARESPAATGAAMECAAQWGAMDALSFNLITSVGAPATQSVRHLHVHVIPRYEGDGLLLPWSARQGQGSVLCDCRSIIQAVPAGLEHDLGCVSVREVR